QPSGHITVSEGPPLELMCNHSSSAQTNLFWYVQYPNQGLQFLLKFSVLHGIDDDFLSSSFLRALSGFFSSLHVSSLQTTDSGTYFCAVQ
ncbi:hypothetical protein K5549_021171, partial [Capra hircus]